MMAGSGARQSYVAWLKRHFGLDPAAEPDAVVGAAEEEYTERFVSWLDRYVAGFAEEYKELISG